MPKIVVHSLVKNEQRWIWFALSSVLPHVDEVMVWDTGSTDDTLLVVKSLASPKVKARQVHISSPDGHTAVRNQMLKETHGDWLLVLDGDEIWWDESLKKCLHSIVSHPEKSALISPFINVVGDIFHRQPASRSHYSIHGHTGSFNLRFINLAIPGLHVGNPHGRQEYRDKNEVPLQSFPSDKLLFVDAPYLHTTHLLRSINRTHDVSALKRDFKYRYEPGIAFPSDFIYPQVLYVPHSELVPDPFVRRTPGYYLRSLFIETGRTLKHSLLPVSTKSGY